jgi:hypothetical protein
MRAANLALAGTFVAGGLLAGCGGSSSDTSSIATVGSSTTTPTTLSHTAYISQADQICAESNAAISAIVPGSTSAEQTAAATQESAIVRDEISSLQSLGTPEGPSPAKFLSALQDVNTQLNRKRLALQQGNASELSTITAALDSAEAKAQSAGASFGFKKCGGVSAPSGTPVTGAGGGGGGGATPTTTVAPTTTTVAPTTTTPPVTTTPPSGGGSSPAPTPTTTTTPTGGGGGGGVSPGGGVGP